jgi:uncharacterized protein (TIGR02145 family)
MNINTAAGALRVTCESFDYSGTHLGERKITATIQSAEPIDFAIGDYFLYYTTYTTERFYLQTAPVVTRVYNSLMLQYNLTFWWVGYELRLVNFLDWVTGEPNEFYYSSNAEVDFYGDANYLMRKVKYNMDRAGYTWEYLIDSASGTAAAVNKTLLITNQNCWEVVALIQSEWGLDFKIKADIRTVIIGQAADLVKFEGDPYVFEYGIHKGLCEINRLQNEQKIITRVYGYGSTRNIAPNYRTGDNHEYHPRLILPTADGYIQDDDLVAIYGVREGQYVNEDIYPSLDCEIHSFEQILDKPTTDTPQQVRTLVKEEYTSWAYDPATYPGASPVKIYTIHPAEYQLVNVPDSEYSKFVIYIEDPGFNINDENIKTTTDPAIAFTTGNLVGIEFKILSYEKKMKLVGGVPTWDNNLYKITIEKTFNTANYSLPNETITPTAGDKLVFLYINMAQTYVDNAEARLLSDTEAWFETQKKSPEGYSIKVPEEFVVRKEGVEYYLRESNAVMFKDTLLGVTDPVPVLIQSISISHKLDSLLPVYDLTISDTPIKGAIQKIDSQLKSATRQIATNKLASKITENNNLKSAHILNETLFDNSGNLKGGRIAPDSILNSSLNAEIRQTRYILQAYFEVNYLGDENVAYGSTGALIHKDRDIVWGGVYDESHQVWAFTEAKTFELDALKYYYVYMKCNKDTGDAEWVLSETKITCESIEGYYMLEWGFILPVRDNIRYSQNEHGVNVISAYVYVAYGSSLLGADFTTTPNDELKYMAILSSPSEIEEPSVEMFDGLWWKRKGEDGSAGNDVVAGDGMDFTTNDPVTLGMPSEVNGTTVNEVTETSHTHKLGKIDVSSISKANGYGALYNILAAVDERKISSSDDWIIPAQSNYESLLNAIDTYDADEGVWPLAGGLLKETGYSHWQYPNEGAINQVNFTALGGGERDSSLDSIFRGMPSSCCLWTITSTGTPRPGSLEKFYILELAALVAYAQFNNRHLNSGVSIRLCNPSTLRSEAEYGEYTGNDGTTYTTKVIDGVEWMILNLNETKFRDGSWISGYDGGTYTPISNEDWDSRGTSGDSLMCYYEDDEANGGLPIPLSDLIISEHNLLKGLDGGDPTNNFYGHLTEEELASVQSSGTTFQVHIKFEAVEAFTYTCPYALKFTAMIHQQTNAPTLSVALDTNMAQYDDLVITPDEIGLVTLTGEWL